MPEGLCRRAVVVERTTPRGGFKGSEFHGFRGTGCVHNRIGGRGGG